MITVWASKVQPGHLVAGYEHHGPIATVRRDCPARLPGWMRSTDATTADGVCLLFWFWERVRVSVP